MSRTEMKIWAGALLTATGGGVAALLGRGALTVATTLCLQYCGVAASHLQDAASPPGSPSVWSMGWAARGAAIEAQLGGNLPAAFPTIDRFAAGEATSIKSLDLNASTYENAGKLLSTVEGYVDKLAAFNGATRGGVEITADQITARQLQLAVPGVGTAAQQTALMTADEYARKHGVKLTITRVK